MLLVTEHRFFIDFLTAPKRREMSEITHPYAAHVLYSPEQPFCMSVYQGCRGYGHTPWVWVWGGCGDDLPSPQTHGDSMGIVNQPEITR